MNAQEVSNMNNIEILSDTAGVADAGTRALVQEGPVSLRHLMAAPRVPGPAGDEQLR